MDIEIVNTILRLCIEEQICLFDLSFLLNYFHENNLCSNSKYILASIRNYIEIFKISRDQRRIEFFMPFEICRSNGNHDELCTNIHVCYDYFYTNSCRYSNTCSLSHVLNVKHDEKTLGILINLNLDLLSKAFRVYCQLNKHLANHKPSLIKSNTMISTRLNRNASWRIRHHRIKSIPKQEISEKGLQIFWTPHRDIEAHFIEVVFSNQSKSNGGPIRIHHIYQHLGVAQVFYENPDLADPVVLHGQVTFQSFTFTSRLLQRTIDKRHLCLSNMPLKQDRIDLYIDTISKPYKKINYQYYQNDPQIIVIEYAEDIDFSRIGFNVRNNPECDGMIINCIQLYLPETLFIEYNSQQYSEDDIRKLFDQENIFHTKTYSNCAFVHFYSHTDLRKSIDQQSNHFICVTPIYIDIYSQQHLEAKMMTPVISSDNPLITEENISDSDDDDDFHDIPSEFDGDDFVLDDSTEINGDMEFLHSAAKNLMASLTEMEAATTEANTLDAPNSLLYGDDYIVTIKNRRFALAFLDYTRFRIEKQRNPDRYRLLASLKKLRSTKKRLENSSSNDQTSESKSAKKKRHKRNKNKKKSNQNEDEGIQLTDS